MYRSKGRVLPTFEVNSSDLPAGCEVYLDVRLNLVGTIEAPSSDASLQPKPESLGLRGHAFSPCGKYLIYILDRPPTTYKDISTVCVRRTDAPFPNLAETSEGDLDSGLLPDIVQCENLYPNLCWRGDSSGFFYAVGSILSC